MYQVGILSKQGRLLTLTSGMINRHFLLEPKTFPSAEIFAQNLKAKSFSAFVVIADDFKENHVKLIEEVKRYYNDVPIVLLVDRISEEARLKLLILKKTMVLHLTKELNDLNGIILKLIHNHRVVHRIPARHKISLLARVHQKEQKSYSAWALDLSETGSCVRVYGNRFKSGDKVEIEIPLSELNKTHRVSATIIWARDEKVRDQAPLTQKIGIQFDKSFMKEKEASLSH